MRICVYGAASAELADCYLQEAYRFGETLAKHQIGLVYGAGASGVMGALARGADANGGEIIGVSPQFFRADGILYDRCTKLFYTLTMRQRKQKMEELSDAFVMLPGGIGTFDEFFEILTLKQLGQHKKPIAILNTCGYYDTLMAFMEQSIEQKFMKKTCKELYFISRNIEEVLDYVSQEKAPPVLSREIGDYKEILFERRK